MATATASPVVLKTTRRNPNSERVFFSGMSLLLLAFVFAGFAHTYYLAGVFRAPLPSLTIHVHAVLFSSWLLLLIAQTSLVSARRVDVHRRLGIAGFSLACLMVIAGILAATDMMRRGASPPGLDPKTFYAVPIGHMLIFSVLIYFAFSARRVNPVAHKRLILIATIVLTDAAGARWPLNVVTHRPYMNSIFLFAFLLLIVGYDLWQTRRVQLSTMWAGALAAIVPNILVPVGTTSAWHTVADWAAR